MLDAIDFRCDGNMSEQDVPSTGDMATSPAFEIAARLMR
jgi:hypothetical protein